MRLLGGNRWTTGAIPDLSGRVAVVTGASSGIGLKTAVELARRGAETVLACRSPERGERALEALRQAAPGARAEVMALDLASLASVERFSGELSERHPRLDLLVNNAGVMAAPYGRTEDGFELHLGTNHLGHFALTGRLLGRLLQTPGARVVTVSSIGHRSARLDLDDLHYERGGYRPMAAYYRSKLLNLLFCYELHRRLERSGSGVLSLAAHPGVARTELMRHIATTWYRRAAFRLLGALLQGAATGALPTLRAAADPDARGGEYYGPRGLLEWSGHPVLVSSSPAARSERDARRLWEISEELTGVRYELIEPAA